MGLLSDLFKRYGVTALIGVVFLAVVLWGAAHFTAAPGKAVSILWGLVSYTKDRDSGAEASPLPAEAPVAAPSAPNHRTSPAKKALSEVPVVITLEAVDLKPWVGEAPPNIRLVVALNGSVNSLPAREITTPSSALALDPQSIVMNAPSTPFSFELELLVEDPPFPGSFSSEPITVSSLPFASTERRLHFRTNGTDSGTQITALVRLRVERKYGHVNGRADR